MIMLKLYAPNSVPVAKAAVWIPLPVLDVWRVPFSTLMRRHPFAALDALKDRRGLTPAPRLLDRDGVLDADYGSLI